MQYTKLGRTGMTVSRICLGCMSYGGGEQPAWARPRDWALSKAEAREHFAAALEAGVTFFDTADVYSVGLSEEITGHWLGEMAQRDDIVVATKCNGAMGPGPNRRGLSRKHVIEACENSLRRLKMDYIDLYQIHRWDAATPVEETLDALDALVRAGKVRYLGASSMAAWQFSKALYAGAGARLAPLRGHAEPLQPDLSRGGARDDPAVPGPGRGDHSVEPAGARVLRRQPPGRGRRLGDPALADGRLRAADVFPRQRFQGGCRRRADRPPARGHPHPGRLRLDSAGAGRHRPHHRRHQADAVDITSRRASATTPST